MSAIRGGIRRAQSIVTERNFRARRAACANANIDVDTEHRRVEVLADEDRLLDDREATGMESQVLAMSDNVTDAHQRLVDELSELARDGRRWDQKPAGDAVTDVQ